MKKKKKTKKKKHQTIIPKYRILNVLRELHCQTLGYKQAKEKAKVDQALYQCQKCGDLYYRGVSKKNLEELRDKYFPLEIQKGKLQIDHIETVVDIKKGFEDYDTYIERLFCPPEKLRAICKPCHDKVTKEQNLQRKFYAIKKNQID